MKVSAREKVKRLREHLLKNWDVAEEWVDKAYASNGARCLVIALVPDGDYLKTGIPQEGSRSPGVMLLELNEKHGREGVLMFLDFMLLGKAV